MQENNETVDNSEECFTITEECDNTEFPQLKFRGQTPLIKGNNKRSRVSLSPEELSNENRVNSSIEAGIQKALEDLIPTIVQKLKKELSETINAIVEDKFKTLRAELEDHSNFERRKIELKALSETEFLQTYNRRDNIKILGLPEQSAGKETYEETSKAVVNLASEIGVKLEETDISIAHRLPSKGHIKPVIVKFIRRSTKIAMLKKKKIIPSNLSAKIYEDISRERLAFVNLMRSDIRINATWTREGAIFYEWKPDGLVYKINGLYEGGVDLSYNLEDVMRCFKRTPFSGRQANNQSQMNQPFRIDVGF